MVRIVVPITTRPSSGWRGFQSAALMLGNTFFECCRHCPGQARWGRNQLDKDVCGALAPTNDLKIIVAAIAELYLPGPTYAF